MRAPGGLSPFGMGRGDAAVLAKIPAMPAPCREMGERLHRVILESVPSPEPVPPVGELKPRGLHLREDDGLDEKQLASWVRQAAAIPGLLAE